MTVLSYTVDVFNAGTTSYSTSAIEFSLDLADLERPPTIIGPVVRPFEGRTESRSWTVDVVDGGGGFTAQLADSGGRLDLLNRVVRVRRSLDNATATVIGTGRLRDVAMADHVAAYRLTVEHEHVLARSALIFNTSNTTRLFPPGPHVTYGPFAPPPKGEIWIGGYINLGGTRMFRCHFEPGWVPMTDLAFEAIKADIRPQYVPNVSPGNFEHVRLRVGNSTYKVNSFGTVLNPTFSNPGGGMPDPNPIGDLGDVVSQAFRGPILWAIVSSSTAFAVGQSYSSAFLHMFSAPPSEATPLHIGASAGLHPMTLKRQLWNGSYSSAGQPKVRYSTAAFNNGSTGLELVPMPRVRYRITEPQQMGRWIEDHLNAPFGVVDFLDSSGRLRPRSVWLPNSTSVFSFAFTSTNLREPHPSWLQPGREMVTALKIEHTDEQWVIGGLVPALAAEYLRPSNASADFIRATARTTEVFHDRVAQLGYRPIAVAADGVHTKQFGIFDYPFTPTPDPNLQSLTAILSREVFERFGDGPIVGSLTALSAASTVAEGDFVRVTLPTFPNPGIAARGGTRLVQIMGKAWMPDGYQFDYLDVGPNLNPLTAPTVTLALSTVNKKHLVNATIAGVPSGGAFQLDAAISATTAAPAPASTTWTRVRTSGVSTGVYPIGSRPAGSKTWARVRGTKGLRVRSSWRNSTAGVTSSGLASPTITMSSVTARSALATLTLGETLYGTQVFADTSTSATFGNSNLVATLPPGQKLQRIVGLTGNTKHLVGARHVDPYGGLSAAGSTTLTTLTTGSSGNWRGCPAPGGLSLGYPSL